MNKTKLKQHELSLSRYIHRTATCISSKTKKNHSRLQYTHAKQKSREHHHSAQLEQPTRNYMLSMLKSTSYKLYRNGSFFNSSLPCCYFGQKKLNLLTSCKRSACSMALRTFFFEVS